MMVEFVVGLELVTQSLVLLGLLVVVVVVVEVLVSHLAFFVYLKSVYFCLLQELQVEWLD